MMFVKGYKMSEEHKRKIGDANRVSRPHLRGEDSNHWQGGKLCIDCGKERGRYGAVRCKPCSGLVRRGENNHNWKGGKSKERVIDMGRTGYKNWRKDVFKRDNWTCKICDKRGGQLEADHILGWAAFPRLRHSVDNGRTLCRSCHLSLLTHGASVEEQIELANVRFE